MIITYIRHIKLPNTPMIIMTKHKYTCGPPVHEKKQDVLNKAKSIELTTTIPPMFTNIPIK